MKLTGESYIIIFLLIICLALSLTVLGMSRQLKVLKFIQEELDDQYRTTNWRLDGLIKSIQDLLESFNDILKKPLETFGNMTNKPLPAKKGRPKKVRDNG